MDEKNYTNLEKGFSRLDELKKKIEDERYLNYAINKMANQICEGFFK